ncbi:MAG: ABC transporter permease [Gammaproteobacteria bacterium]|nr:ABC transporter permease [Gammaproteobacteria bacterium]
MKVFIAIALFALWLVLSASFNPAHVVLGAIVALIVAWINPIGTPYTRRFLWLRALGYAPWLFGRVVKSGLHVSRLILYPALPIKPELIQHKTKLRSEGELVVLGNSITLTPGTITVEVAPGELIVHAIDASAQQDLISGVLDEKVSRLFSAWEGDQ